MRFLRAPAIQGIGGKALTGQKLRILISLISYWKSLSVRYESLWAQFEGMPNILEFVDCVGPTVVNT